MGFITDPELKTYLTAHLKVSASTGLESKWDTLIPPANAGAFAKIRRKLLLRGYTMAEINQWDDGTECQRALAMCQLMVHAGEAETPDDWQQKFCDKGDELLEDAFTINGEIVDVHASTAAVGHGNSNNNPNIGPWAEARS